MELVSQSLSSKQLTVYETAFKIFLGQQRGRRGKFQFRKINDDQCMNIEVCIVAFVL